jgi:hypothetical protein
VKKREEEREERAMKNFYVTRNEPSSSSTPTPPRPFAQPMKLKTIKKRVRAQKENSAYARSGVTLFLKSSDVSWSRSDAPREKRPTWQIKLDRKELNGKVVPTRTT